MEAMPLSPSSWPGVATVLLGSVSEQSCGACVFIGDLLFTDPTSGLEEVISRPQRSYDLWLAGERYGQFVPLPLSSGCS